MPVADERLKVALAMVLMGPNACDLVLLDEPDSFVTLLHA